MISQKNTQPVLNYTPRHSNAGIQTQILWSLPTGQWGEGNGIEERQICRRQFEASIQASSKTLIHASQPWATEGWQSYLGAPYSESISVCLDSR